MKTNTSHFVSLMNVPVQPQPQNLASRYQRKVVLEDTQKTDLTC